MFYHWATFMFLLRPKYSLVISVTLHSWTIFNFLAPFLLIISCIRLINAYAVAFVLGIRGCNHTVSVLIFSCVVFSDIMSLLHRACYTCTGQTEINFVLFSFWILFWVQTKKWKENNFSSEVVGPSLYIGCSGMNGPNYTARKWVSKYCAVFTCKTRIDVD